MNLLKITVANMVEMGLNGTYLYRGGHGPDCIEKYRQRPRQLHGRKGVKLFIMRPRIETVQRLLFSIENDRAQCHGRFGVK